MLEPHTAKAATFPPKRKSLSPNEDGEEDEEPVRKRSRREDRRADIQVKKEPPASGNSASPSANDLKRKPAVNGLGSAKQKTTKRAASGSDSPPAKTLRDKKGNDGALQEEVEDEGDEDEEEDELESKKKPKAVSKAREQVQATLDDISKASDPYPDWKPDEPVPYAALCTTFSLVELTTKRLVISSYCSQFLRQVLRLTPNDLLPTVQLMINKLAADYAGIELGIGESLIMKAIGEATGRSLNVIKADQAEIGDLGLVAAKSRSTQPTMFKPKPLTVHGVLNSLMGIATIEGHGSQQRKVDGIKKLLSAADAAHTGKGSKSIDVTKDKGGPSEAKYIIRFLEGKLRLGLAERTVIVALAHAMVMHEAKQKGKKTPSPEELAEGEVILKSVFRYGGIL